MNARRRRLATAGCGAIFLLAAWLLLGGDSSYRVHATFANVAGLRENSEVRVDGVPVGTVAKLSLNSDDSVSATLELDASAAPVGRDARVAIRSKNLLGQRLVDLDPGSVRRPLPSGGAIPRSQTGTPVDLDELLAVLDTDTRTRLEVLVHESGTALAGRGADFNRLLGELPGSLDRTHALLDELSADNRALARLLAEGEPIAGSLARERRSLGQLVVTARDSFDTLSARRGELRETLRRAPGALGQARETLARLEGAAIPLRPAAARLRQTAAPLARVLDAIGEFEPSAVAALRAATATAPELGSIISAATPLVGRLQPAAEDLARFAESAQPVSSTLDVGIGDTLASLEGWARAIQGRDGLGHYFRGHANINRDLIESLVESYVSPLSDRSASGGRDDRVSREARGGPRGAEVRSRPRERATSRRDRARERGPREAPPAPLGHIGRLDLRAGESRPIRSLLDFLLGP